MPELESEMNETPKLTSGEALQRCIEIAGQIAVWMRHLEGKDREFHEDAPAMNTTRKGGDE